MSDSNKSGDGCVITFVLLLLALICHCIGKEVSDLKARIEVLEQRTVPAEKHDDAH